MHHLLLSNASGTLPEAFDRLNLSDPEQIIEYEQAFYKGMIKVEDNPLVHQLLYWSPPNQRLATRIPYVQQTIYLQRTVQGVIDTGMAINTTLQQFQAATLDFPTPETTEGICELLTFFSVLNRHSSVKIKFWLRCCRELYKLGFHTAYGTCAPYSLLIFCRMGATVLATTEINHEQRYFVQFSVKEIALKGRQVAGRPEIVCLD
jgi:hypothetical protein